MIEFIADMFGAIIRLIYTLTQDNYALSIVLFTILTKIILFPLSLKQMKSNEELQKIKPKYDEIVKKYKNDKIKQSEEVTKLYAEHKINPLGGCLPLLIQLPLILAMFYIVRQPLTYVLQMPQEEIKIYTQELLAKEEVTDMEMDSSEIKIATNNKLIDMDFMGIKELNLGAVPSDVFSSDETKKSHPLTIIIPILSILVSIYQIKQSQRSSEMTEEQKEMQKSMNRMMPMLSGFIAFTMPLALGVYWLISGLCQITQQLIISKLMKEHKKDGVNLLLDSDRGGKNNEKND